MITHISSIVRKAVRGRYAIGAFNTSNLEVTLGIVRAAVKLKSPVIIQTSESALTYAGWKTLPLLIRSVSEETGRRVPIALHLDHSKEPAAIKAAMRFGIHSVMMDGSSFPLKKNILETSRMVRYAHRRGVWVQGEIGRIVGSEDWVNVKSGDALLTQVDEAVVFAHATRVDALAIAIGTMHGIKKVRDVKPKLHLDRLRAIHAVLPGLPLVLHGASHVPAETLSRAAAQGIAIVNIDTDLRLAFTGAMRDYFKKNPDAYDPRKIEQPAIDAVQKEVEAKIRILGSAGKA